MSLGLLFGLITLLTIDIPLSFNKGAKFIGFLPLLKRNWLAIISAIMFLVSWGITKHMKHVWKGTYAPVHKIKEIKNENYEYLTFLTTYIIPLICIDLSDLRYVIVLGILLIIIGIVFVKTELYYGNPVLAILGYRLYRAEIYKHHSVEGVILITREPLSAEMDIKWKPITENVWIVKGVESDGKIETKTEKNN